METILDQTELSDIFTMGAEVEIERSDAPEVAIYFASPDMSTSVAFTPDEWREFADRIKEIDENVPF